MNLMHQVVVICVTASLLLLTACSAPVKESETKAVVSESASLYARLGGLPAITAVVDDFLVRLASNPLLGPRFAGANMPRLRDKLILLIASAAGGPEVYDGGSMMMVHKGMDISEQEFSSLVGDLIVSLNHFQVPAKEQSELLALLGPMRSDIVSKGPSGMEQFTVIEGYLRRIERRLAKLEASQSAKSAVKELPSIERKVVTTGGPPPTKWSAEEKQMVESLIERYTAASEAVNGEKRRDLIGYPLSYTRFLADDGSVIDLNDSLGKPHVLFIMRGFSGEFCLHCSTQLISIARSLEEFKKRGVPVHVIYPGDANTVVPFVAGIKKLDKQFRPPFSLLLDVDLVAVKEFLIEGSLAKPTTMILDEDGIVRWAYVGKQPSDRPSVATVLTALDEFAVTR